MIKYGEEKQLNGINEKVGRQKRGEDSRVLREKRGIRWGFCGEMLVVVVSMGGS